MTVEDHGTEAMALPKRFENNGLILEYLLLEKLPNMAHESLLPSIDTQGPVYRD